MSCQTGHYDVRGEERFDIIQFRIIPQSKRKQLRIFIVKGVANDGTHMQTVMLRRYVRTENDGMKPMGAPFFIYRDQVDALAQALDDAEEALLTTDQAAATF